MEDAGYAAIAKVTMHQREHIVVIRARAEERRPRSAGDTTGGLPLTCLKRRCTIFKLNSAFHTCRPRARRILPCLTGAGRLIGLGPGARAAARFPAVLFIAQPCPLLIHIPVAIIGSSPLSARRSIIIKNPAVL